MGKPDYDPAFDEPYDDAPVDVFEILDCTNDEAFYPLGVFLSLDAAFDAIQEELNRNAPISDSGCNEEAERIQIRKRKTGWNLYGKCVYLIERRLEWNSSDEDDDSRKWVTFNEVRSE